MMTRNKYNQRDSASLLNVGNRKITANTKATDNSERQSKPNKPHSNP